MQNTRPPSPAAVLKLLEAEIAYEGGVRALARRWKISATMISHVRSGKAKVTPRILAHLGWKRLTTLVPR